MAPAARLIFELISFNRLRDGKSRNQVSPETGFKTVHRHLILDTGYKTVGNLCEFQNYFCQGWPSFIFAQQQSRPAKSATLSKVHHIASQTDRQTDRQKEKKREAVRKIE